MLETEKSPSDRALPTSVLPQTPPGLQSLYLACRRIYPDQPNPLQVAAVVKYWLGGPDPLDYISMYSNPGNPQLGVSPHWHYVSFGLSDLHGDGRVHQTSGPGGLSGFGFELTFRLKREQGETAPPTWPAALLQALAKYVFHSGNTVCAGDHVSWHSALDGSESSIQHMLLTNDPQLEMTETPCGSVTFIQVVGVCKEELKASQKWNGLGVLDILKHIPRGGGGGAWLVTDMRRGESMLQLDPGSALVVERGIETDGSNLSGVTASCTWSETLPGAYGGKEEVDSGSEESDSVIPTNAANLDKGACSQFLSKQVSHCSGENQTIGSYSFPERFESPELLQTKKLDSVHLTFNLESGSLLPLAIRGRVKHGRHFTFKSVLGNAVITLVAESVTGTFVDCDKPYVAHGPWLQVLIPDEFTNEMVQTLQPLASNLDQVVLPKTFMWSERNLAITVLPDSIPPDMGHYT